MRLMSMRETPLPPVRKRIRVRVVAGLGVIILGLFILLQLHLKNYAYFIVTSESMEPTLNIGDRLVMQRARSYHPGDIVTLYSPQSPQTVLVKRLIALGPALVEAHGDRLFTDGQPIDPPLGPTPEGNWADPPGQTWKINPDEAFVAGDNRTVSEDSRDFGPVTREALMGQVKYRIKSVFDWEKVQ